jgi:hypothetical protein
MQATLARLQISRAGSCNWDKLLESKTRNEEVLLKKINFERWNKKKRYKKTLKNIQVTGQICYPSYEIMITWLKGNQKKSQNPFFLITLKDEIEKNSAKKDVNSC